MDFKFNVANIASSARINTKSSMISLRVAQPVKSDKIYLDPAHSEQKTLNYQNQRSAMFWGQN